MFKRFFSLIVLIVFSWAFVGVPVLRAEETEFNPNYILSDAEMQDWKSMSELDIDVFLRAKGGSIANMVFIDTDGASRTAASLIARAAATHQINPKYFIVKLQKEQSLVTDQNPSQKQIDWATGYGVCDGCSTDDPALQKYKGFANQIDSAGAIIRWYYDHLNTEAWIRRAGIGYVIDGTMVTPLTNATGFLYTYTPHLHGNQNFWRLWYDWFEDVYPNGTLLKSKTSSAVYVVRDGKKHPIASMTVLKSRYNAQLIVSVPDSELSRYQTGSIINLPNYSIVQANSSYYLLDDDTARPFADASVLRSLGYNPDEIIQITENDLAGYEKGEIITATSQPVGRLVKIKETGSLYFLKDGYIHPVADSSVAKAIFPQLTIEKISIESLGEVELGQPPVLKDGTLIGSRETGKIFAVDSGFLRHITSEAAFTGLGYSWKNVVWTTQTFLSLYPSGMPLAVRRADLENTQSLKP